MRMSEGVEWGIHCLTALAATPAGTTVPAKLLAEFHGVSVSYLLKHLKALAAAGLLESVPGPRGGYRLRRAPDAITLLEVVDAVEGGGHAFRCTEIRRNNPTAPPGPRTRKTYARPCTIKVAMLRAESAWRRELAGQTIADIVRTLSRVVDADQLERGQAWLAERLQR